MPRHVTWGNFQQHIIKLHCATQAETSEQHAAEKYSYLLTENKARTFHVVLWETQQHKPVGVWLSYIWMYLQFKVFNINVILDLAFVSCRINSKKWFYPVIFKWHLIIINVRLHMSNMSCTLAGGLDIFQSQI